MRKLLLLICFILFVSIVNAQELDFQGGISISKLKYQDSQGNELQNVQPTDNFFMVIEYRQAILKKIFKEKLFTDLGLGYNRYGSTASDITLDNYYSWDLSYIGINLGLDYEFYRPGDFTFYAKATISPEFLIRGTQTINDQVYDLRGEDDFNTPYTFFRGGLGIKYKATHNTSFYIQYMGGKSFGFRSDPEKINFVAHNFGIGILINLSGGKSGGIGMDPNTSQRLRVMEDRINVYSIKIDSLEMQAQQVEKLEKEIEEKEKEILMIKDTLSQVLYDFDGKGLAVNKRDGKIYVTLDNDMLFEPGSWIVGDEGVKAVEALGKGLELNPDTFILIEGHTDNEPYNGGGDIKDNWDLSLKRATAVVDILKNNPNINPKNITAAGRGEYDPITGNDTAEGRAKNRRIEVIIIPDLEKASKILEN